jgi:hypothetical protein
MPKSIYRSRREQLHRAMVYVKAERILEELVNDLQIEALRIG